MSIGDYSYFRDENELLKFKDHFINFADGIRIGYATNKNHGRGVFATRNFKRGELIFAERAIIVGSFDGNNEEDLYL